MARLRPLSEEEWLSCGYPGTMLGRRLRTADARKLRLFLCACCRRVWNSFPDERCRAAVTAAESWADGKLSAGALAEHRSATEFVRAREERAYQEVRFDLTPSSQKRRKRYYAAQAAAWVVVPRKDRILRAAYACTVAAPATRDEEGAHCDILRDIFGNPFRPVAFDADWRTSTAVAIAQGMYDSRDFGAMPILADALQDAGCDNDDVLNHCRDAKGVHVRGCWVVDLVLGKS
jgi:hypothetical protein